MHVSGRLAANFHGSPHNLFSRSIAGGRRLQTSQQVPTYSTVELHDDDHSYLSPPARPWTARELRLIDLTRRRCFRMELHARLVACASLGWHSRRFLRLSMRLGARTFVVPRRRRVHSMREFRQMGAPTDSRAWWSTTLCLLHSRNEISSVFGSFALTSTGHVAFEGRHRKSHRLTRRSVRLLR